MTRKERLIKLMADLDELDQHKQSIDYMERDLKKTVEKLKLTKKDYEMVEKEFGYNLEYYLKDLDII